MIKIDGYHIDNKNTIRYDYKVSSEIARYFNPKQPFFVSYDTDISSVPPSIAVIPLLANLMPIAWFVGFDVEVDEVDSTFYNALEELKAEFSVHFKNIKPSSLKAVRLVSNTIAADESALLFSGGLDSFESLTRNIDRNPFLVSVFGADIDLSDTRRQDDFKTFNNAEPIVKNDRLCYVTSNLRTFYTFDVDLLVDVNWWGKIQHGMALISIIAPLSFINGIRTVMIASSNTGEVSFGWGSTSETDEKVRWANSQVIHDGFHLRRTDKIENVVDFGRRTGENVKLRVCYSEWRDGYNCSECPKCQRTILGLILSGANPADFGFAAPKDFFRRVMKNFKKDTLMTTGVAYEWKCLQEKARNSENCFILFDEQAERRAISEFTSLDIDEIANRDTDKKMASRRLKYTIINKFPKLFQAYLKVRRKL